MQNSVSFDSALARLASLGSGTPPPPAAAESAAPAGFVKSSEEYSTTETTETKTFMYAYSSDTSCFVHSLDTDPFLVAIREFANISSLSVLRRRWLVSLERPLHPLHPLLTSSLTLASLRLLFNKMNCNNSRSLVPWICSPTLLHPKVRCSEAYDLFTLCIF